MSASDIKVSDAEILVAQTQLFGSTYAINCSKEIKENWRRMLQNFEYARSLPYMKG